MGISRSPDEQTTKKTNTPGEIQDCDGGLARRPWKHSRPLQCLWNTFLQLQKNVKAFVIANIIIEGKDLQLQFDSLSSIRLIGNYQYDFMESSNMPNLRAIELFNMRVNSNIIKHISTKFDNIFLVISGCELESLDVLALLNSQFNRFLIDSSTVINGDLSQYIYILDPINVRH